MASATDQAIERLKNPEFAKMPPRQSPSVGREVHYYSDCYEGTEPLPATIVRLRPLVGADAVDLFVKDVELVIPTDGIGAIAKPIARAAVGVPFQSDGMGVSTAYWCWPPFVPPKAG